VAATAAASADDDDDSKASTAAAAAAAAAAAVVVVVCRIVLKLTQRLGKTRKSFQLYFLCIVGLLAILNMYLCRVCYGRQNPYLLTTMSVLTPIVHLFGS